MHPQSSPSPATAPLVVCVMALLAVAPLRSFAETQAAPAGDGAAPIIEGSTQPGAKALPVYHLDPVHTRVMFGIGHAGFSKAIGTISGSTGTLRFDPQRWTDATLQVSVPISRLDLGDAQWNKAVLAGNLLNGERYPSAVFVSTKIEPNGPDRATVHGLLTLHGVSKEIALDVKMNALKRHPLPPFRRTVGFSATTKISRKAYGIEAWPSVIGDEVEIRIEAEATRGRDDDDTPPARAPNPAQPASNP